jgi:hypothetical protein
MGSLAFLQSLFTQCVQAYGERGPRGFVVVPIVLVSNEGDASATLSTIGLVFSPAKLIESNPPQLPRETAATLSGTGNISSVTPPRATSPKSFSLTVSLAATSDFRPVFDPVGINLSYYASDGVTVVSKTAVLLSADSGVQNMLSFAGSPVNGTAGAQYLLSFATPLLVDFQ